MKEDASIRFAYETVPGRMLLKLLVHPTVSKAAGAFLDTRYSKPLIGQFQKKYKISTKGIVTPKGGFSDFNSFFSRKRKNVPFDMVEEHLCSPCDGRLSSYPITEEGIFHIKHTSYTLKQLLKSSKRAKKFYGGTALIFRLLPQDYHRYHFVTDGKVLYQREIEGILHCVRPVATEQYPVYVQNSRSYTGISTETFGEMVQMEVGALLVGRICNHPLEAGAKVKRGVEKGYFAYGGSTIVLLLQKGAVELVPELRKALKKEAEVFVKCGMQIGTKQIQTS